MYQGVAFSALAVRPEGVVFCQVENLVEEGEGVNTKGVEGLVFGERQDHEEVSLNGLGV